MSVVVEVALCCVCLSVCVCVCVRESVLCLSVSLSLQCGGAYGTAPGTVVPGACTSLVVVRFEMNICEK